MALTATWHSNAPWTYTGYGSQTKQVVRRLAADGHRMAIAANYGIEQMITEWEGVTVFPRGLDAYNNDIVGPYFDDWTSRYPGTKACQFTLFDVWVLNSPRFDDIPTVSWVPVDHVPAPPAVVEFLRKPNVRPIAMSKFGQEMLAHDKVDATFIPHGIETGTFKPTARVSVSGKMMTGREIMGLDEDQFVVGAINANKGINPSRKSWGENLLAFSLFAQAHDDAVIYLHTERDGAMGGVKLPEIIKSLGLQEHQYRFVNQYAYRMGIPDEGLAAIYTACDVGLMVSMGEGFGLTAAEMQACERPVIVSDFSAQPELLGDGWLVKGQPWWDAAQHGWFNQPIVGNIVEALEAAYARGRGMSVKARKHIVDNYDADMVYQTKWRPFLADLEASL